MVLFCFTGHHLPACCCFPAGQVPLIGVIDQQRQVGGSNANQHTHRYIRHEVLGKVDPGIAN